MTMRHVARRVGGGRAMFVAAFLLFVVGAVLGAVLAGSLGHLLTPLEQSVRREAANMKTQSVWATEWMLFENNWKVSLFMMAGGIVFGILPVIGVLLNGALVGYVVRQMAGSVHASPIVIVLAGIVPHGIFEIPAYCLASGYGMWLGWQVWQTTRRHKQRESWKSIVQVGGVTLLWVTVLLFVAAFIESHITPALLRLALSRT